MRMTAGQQLIYLYDRGRLIGEDVWEPDPNKADIVKPDPEDVLTTAESRKLLRSSNQTPALVRRSGLR
jgi:hypothetical protein